VQGDVCDTSCEVTDTCGFEAPVKQQILVTILTRCREASSLARRKNYNYGFLGSNLDVFNRLRAGMARIESGA
jgi:hypothetical protein